MANETFVKVAYIGLQKQDGSLMLNVPLYVKAMPVNKYTGELKKPTKLIAIDDDGDIPF